MKQISNLDMVKLVVDTEKFYASLTEYEEDDFLMNFSYNPKNLEGVITRGTFVSGELSTSLVYRDKVYRILCIKN
ncbi:MAG: hypothetical protein H6622_14765 [Halobacteriovoraceae bacterium]|nr:hypothetical protein [Halobacteriovoraceae bacterium]